MSFNMTTLIEKLLPYVAVSIFPSLLLYAAYCSSTAREVFVNIIQTAILFGGALLFIYITLWGWAEILK